MMFDDALIAAQEEFEVRQRNGITWQTVHTSVYDLDNGELHLQSQENGIEYVVKFKEGGGDTIAPGEVVVGGTQGSAFITNLNETT